MVLLDLINSATACAAPSPSLQWRKPTSSRAPPCQHVNTCTSWDGINCSSEERCVCLQRTTLLCENYICEYYVKIMWKLCENYVKYVNAYEVRNMLRPNVETCMKLSQLPREGLRNVPSIAARASHRCLAPSSPKSLYPINSWLRALFCFKSGEIAAQSESVICRLFRKRTRLFRRSCALTPRWGGTKSSPIGVAKCAAKITAKGYTVWYSKVKKPIWPRTLYNYTNLCISILQLHVYNIYICIYIHTVYIYVYI